MGPFTKADQLGPFYEANSPNSYELALLLEGQVLGKNCRGISGAIVEVWYAGGNPCNDRKVGYTFPNNCTELWYRGKKKIKADGRFKFKATFPEVYQLRPILHYHYKVTAKKTEFVTQAYFKDKVPKQYEDMVKNNGGFAKVKAV